MVKITDREIVGTAAVRIIEANPERTSLLIQNVHATNILYIGSDNSVSATNGIRLNAGASFRVNSSKKSIASYEYWALASGANTTINVGTFSGKEDEHTDIGTDTGADITIVAEGATGAAVPSSALFVGGTDGTNLRGLSTDAAGALNVLLRSESTSGGAVPSRAVHIAASSGGAMRLLQAVGLSGVFSTAGNCLQTGSAMFAFNGSTFSRLRAESSGNPNLKVGIFSGPSQARVNAPNIDAYNAANPALSVLNFNYDYNGATWDRVRHCYHQPVTGITANGGGTTITMTTGPLSKFTLAVLRTVGASAYTVDIEGSLDGTNWFQLGTQTEPGASMMYHVVDKPVRYVRYNVTTVGAGNTLTTQLTASAK